MGYWTEAEFKEVEQRVAKNRKPPQQKDLFTNRYRQVKPQVPTEDAECRAFWQWVRLHEAKYPALLELYHIPNGGHRFKATAAAMKAIGVRPGRPDYSLDIPMQGFHGLRIEMKRTQDGRLSEDQEIILPRLESNGYKVCVCKGAEEAISAVKSYLEID